MSLIILIISLIFWPIWRYAPNVASDFPYVYKDLLVEGFDIPYAWITRTADGFGSNSLFVLWSWPIDFLYGMIGRLGIGFDMVQILLNFIPFIFLGSYSIWKLLSSFNLSYKAKFAGSLLYLTNTYVLLLLDGGQLSIALSFALLPLLYLSVITSLNSKSIYKKLKTAILVSIYGYLDIRFLYIAFILILLRFVYQIIITKKIKLISWSISGIITLLIFIIFHFYWLWPVINVGLSVPEVVLASSNISFLSFAKLKHAILLLQPHWYLNDFGQIAATRREFIIIPIVAFLSFIIHKNKKEIFFWIFISIIGIILVKGNNPPFGNVYPWLFENIPGFVLFRDPTKFYFLVALGFSVLTAFTFDKLARKIPIFFSIYIIFLLFLIRPVYMGQMTGLFSQLENTESFEQVAEIISSDDTFGRVLWIPQRHPLGYVSEKHPVVEISRIQSLRPFSVGTVGTYETANFLREGTHIQQLLDLAAVEYIVYPFADEKKRVLKQEDKDYYATFSGQLKEKTWTETSYSDENVNLYKLQGEKKIFFVAENIITINEDDYIFNEFGYNSQYRLKNNALVIDDNYREEFYYPAANLQNSPNDQNWWKRNSQDFVWVRNFLQQKYNIDNQDLTYGGGYAINENEGIFTIQSDELLNSKNLYIRLLLSSQGGEIRLYQDNELLTSIDTLLEDPEITTKKLTGYKNIPDRFFEYEKSEFTWFEIENIDSSKNLTIEAEGNINIINAISNTLPEMHNNQLLAGESSIDVSYTKISPAEYQLKINGITDTAMLVFTQTFDSKWRLDGRESVKVYDLFNGYEISEDGKYRLYYSPQKYVNQGLVISLIGSLGILLYIISYEFRKRKKATQN